MLGRLEAAVSRLEALENRIVNTSGSGASSGGRADKVTVTATPPSRAEAGGSSVEAYDNLLTTKARH